MDTPTGRHSFRIIGTLMLQDRLETLLVNIHITGNSNSCHIDEIALNTITLTMMYIKWDSIDQYVQVNCIIIRLNGEREKTC
jgi:hypothetical protein